MTRELAIQNLKQAQNVSDDDPEAAHMSADEVLCELLHSLGYEDVVEQWKLVDKWYATSASTAAHDAIPSDGECR